MRRAAAAGSALALCRVDGRYPAGTCRVVGGRATEIPCAAGAYDYLAPPVNAVVFAMDEKPQIQALERTATVLPIDDLDRQALVGLTV
ncbi:hypothetical protein DI272_28720 [Streptomyces sp. Act143]|nr:hypothetical protein DI272_28720 [Streptomyces sp. Act143]